MGVDQRVNVGFFNPLTGSAAVATGIYALNSGILKVTLSNDASGKVAADAVQLVSK
jgi:hypothetical protein